MGKIELKRIENSLFSSNTYVIFLNNCEDVWLIDCGDFEKVKNWCVENGKKVKGIFITHCHFDHIYGINQALLSNPDIVIYASSLAFDGMRDSKINGSLYIETPFVVDNGKKVELRNGDVVNLCNDTILKVYETPGHSPDSLSFEVGKLFFTGDALIPNIRVVTKIKGGNKIYAQNSVDYIFNHFDNDTLVCPGHKAETVLFDIKQIDFRYV